MGKMHRALNVFVNNLSAGFTFKMSLSHVIFRACKIEPHYEQPRLAFCNLDGNIS
jgi:hypothetical protein